LRRAAEVEAALYTMQEDLDVNFGPVYTVNVRRVFLETGDFHDVESLS
jgi:hypothetical protein